MHQRFLCTLDILASALRGAHRASRLTATLLIGLLALTSADAHARCAQPEDPTDPIFAMTSPGGALFLHRVNDHQPQRIGGPPEPPPTLTLRRAGCSTRCSITVRLTQLATNLYIARLPRSMALGQWTFRTRDVERSIRVQRARATAPMSAPAIARLVSQRAGTRGVARSIELASDPPEGAIGVLVTWPGSSYFSVIEGRSRSVYFAPGRCSDRPPEYVAPTPGVQLQVAFVDALGRTSPAAQVTFVDAPVTPRGGSTP
jgi:hypothetical protein